MRNALLPPALLRLRALLPDPPSEFRLTDEFAVPGGRL